MCVEHAALAMQACQVQGSLVTVLRTLSLAMLTSRASVPVCADPAAVNSVSSGGHLAEAQSVGSVGSICQGPLWPLCATAQNMNQQLRAW